MNAPVTRRALLGATAAVGAVGLPAVAEAGVPALAAAHPDAALFRLLDRYPAARAAAKATGDRSEALWNAFVEQEPARPGALHVRPGDALGCGSARERLADGRWADLYDLPAVDLLRRRPLPFCDEWQGEPAPWNPEEQVGRWVQVPDHAQIARRAEILAAHDAWWAECQVVKERLGIPAADDADEEASRLLDELEDAILATTPGTLAGLGAKARWAAACRVPGWVARWHEQIVRDVLALAERGGVAL